VNFGSSLYSSIKSGVGAGSAGVERREEPDQLGSGVKTGKKTLEDGNISPCHSAKMSLSTLRSVISRHLETLEQQMEEMGIRNEEDRQFAEEMHAWNLQLIAQQKVDQQRIKELEELSKTLEEDQAKAGGGREYLPGPEELQSMTREELNELERRQEEYLLTIRKAKINLIR